MFRTYSLLLILFMVLSVHNAFGQFTITGIISDEAEQALPYTSVVFIDLADSTKMYFTLSEPDGRIQIKDVDSGTYQYQILHSGYGLLEQTVSVKADLDLGKIYLYKSDVTLKEALIKANRIPILFKGDTMVYNANSYQTKSSATVEDLLKQLPGITVTKDGTVQTQGESVVKVLVNGKEFFGDDPTKATRNINADAVEKVEVLDRKTETTEFSGVDDGTREKVINLVLKEDANKGYFGKLQLGAGTDQTYQGKITLNRFNEDNQFTVIGNMNNLNQNGFDWSEYFRMLGGPNGVTLGQRTYWTNQSDWLGRNDEGRQTNAVIGANANFKSGKKSTVNASYFFLDRENDLRTNSNSENFLPESRLFNTSGRITGSTNGQHKLSTTYRLNRDTLNFLTLQGEFNYSFGESLDSSFSINRGDEANLLNHTLMRNTDLRSTINYKGKATYIRKFKKVKNVLTLETGIDRNNSTDTLRWGNQVNTTIPVSPVLLPYSMADQQNGTGSQFYNAASMTFPLKTKKPYSLAMLLESKIGRDSFVQRRLMLNNDSVQSDQSPAIASKYTISKAEGRIFKNFNKEGWYWNLALAYARVDYRRDLQLPVSNSDRADGPVDLFLPSFYAGFRKPQTERLNVWMNSEEVLPGMRDLNPVANIVNPAARSLGNLALEPYARYNGGVSYRRNNPAKQRSFYIWGNVGFNNNGTMNTEFRDSSNFTVTTIRNGNKNRWGGTDMGYSFPLGDLGIDLDLSGGYSFYSYLNEQNNTRFKNLQHSFNLDFDVEMTLGPIELSLGYEPEYSIQFSELFNTVNYWRHEIYGDMIISLGDRIEWNSEFSVFLFSSSGVGTQQAVPVWNSGFTWILDSTNTWELSVVGYDMLNRAQSIDRNLFSSGYTEVRRNTLTQFFMLNLAYSIRKGKKKERENFRF